MTFAKFNKRGILEARQKAQGVIVKTVFPGINFEFKKLDIDLGDRVARGQNVDLFLPETLNEIYGRDNLCLKLFKLGGDIWGHPRGVGRSPILESTMVQNLMAIRGLAPRVFDIVRVGDNLAHVSEYIKGESKALPISDPRFHFDGNETKNDESWVGGKLVDFQGTIFNDFTGWKKSLIARAEAGTKDRGSGGRAYQSGPDFDGFRNTEERLKKFKFSEFKDKKVLDIGCAYGMFSRAAVDLGAKRVVGLDWPSNIIMAQELAILNGYFNIDFYGVDLKKQTAGTIRLLTGIAKFDIHLFLAMENWIGWPDWAKNCDVLYYEGHGKERAFEVFDYRKSKPKLPIDITVKV